MERITATATVATPGPLAQVVDAYCACLGEVAASGVTSPADWAPIAAYMDTTSFKRVGAYLEELDWDGYCRFLTEWAGGTAFEMTVFRVTEAGNLVIQEIEERHTRGDAFIRKNVVAIYAFNADGKIRHLDIYEQAKDSGRWIEEAAAAAMA